MFAAEEAALAGGTDQHLRVIFPRATTRDRRKIRAISGIGGAPAVAQGRVVGLLLENNPYCRQEDLDHFAEGMRKAGIPG